MNSFGNKKLFWFYSLFKCMLLFWLFTGSFYSWTFIKFKLILLFFLIKPIHFHLTGQNWRIQSEMYHSNRLPDHDPYMRAFSKPLPRCWRHMIDSNIYFFWLNKMSYDFLYGFSPDLNQHDNVCTLPHCTALGWTEKQTVYHRCVS